jgi:hypothetical protein
MVVCAVQACNVSRHRQAARKSMLGCIHACRIWGTNVHVQGAGSMALMLWLDW